MEISSEIPDLSINGLHPFRPVCEQWLKKIELATQRKYEQFTKYANEASKFYDGNHNWMWEEEFARSPSGFLNEDAGNVLPMFRMTVNRAFEAVALFGPALYHQNPNITATAHVPPSIEPEAMGVDPNDPFGMDFFQQMMMTEKSRQNIRKTHASLMQTYLNWLQLETDKKTQSRRAINEAIVKGMSTMWPEVYQPPGSNIKYPRSVYVSVDDIQIDPDAKYYEDIQWVARKCVAPVNLVEDEYGLPRGSLKGHFQSSENQGNVHGSMEEKTERERRERDGLGRTHDLIEYYKIYSKNGFGNYLQQSSLMSDVYTKYDFTQFGPYNFLVVARGVPFPLNVPSNVLEEEEFEEVFARVQWPIPFWSDPNCDGGWPFTRIFFYESPDTHWPISLFKPCMGELKFVNWCMSFLADKVAQSATTYLGVLKSAGAEIQKQLNGPSQPYKLIEISEATGKKLSDVVSFVQAPNFSIDIWNMVSEVMTLIDKNTGLTDLIYGLTNTQIRSAREADVKDQNVSIRPDDMASRTEDFLSNTASKEMQIARWVCDGEDVRPTLGPIGSNIWDEQMLTENYDELVRDYTFRVEAGSARKPNKSGRISALTQLGQVVMSVIEGMAMNGNVEPWNAYMADTAKALDLDPAPYMLQPPPPQEGPSPEEQELQIEQMKAEMQMQIDQAKLQMQQQSVQLQQQGEMMKLFMEQERHEQEMDQDQEAHDQEMKQALAKGRLDQLLMRARVSNAKKPAPSANGSGRK